MITDYTISSIKTAKGEYLPIYILHTDTHITTGKHYPNAGSSNDFVLEVRYPVFYYRRKTSSYDQLYALLADYITIPDFVTCTSEDNPETGYRTYNFNYQYSPVASSWKLWPSAMSVLINPALQTTGYSVNEADIIIITDGTNYYFHHGSWLYSSGSGGTFDPGVEEFPTTTTWGNDFQTLRINQYDYTDVTADNLLFAKQFIEQLAPEESTDPYSPGGTSPSWPYSGTDPIGGGGTFELETDPIPEPTVPTISAVDCGFVTLYNPTLAQLDALSAYMWSPLFDLNTLKKLFADPMDIILALLIVPLQIPDGGIQEVTVGGFPTGVFMTKAAQQYIELDCGSVDITTFFGSYLDYQPYTKIQCYLPFIGMVELSADEVVGRTINIKYMVDIATGSCTAFIRITTPSGTRASKSSINGPLYSFSGQCCQSVPITGQNFSQLLSSLAQVAMTSIAAGVGGAAASAGAAIDKAKEGFARGLGTALPEFQDTSVQPMRQMMQHSGTGWLAPVTTGYQGSGVSMDAHDAAMAEGPQTMLPEAKLMEIKGTAKTDVTGITSAAGAVATLASSVMGSKASITHTGSMSAISGMMGIKKPFLIITRPNLTLAEHYHELSGYPANSYVAFSDLTGYTEVEVCRLENMSCTVSELAEIYSNLKSGVIF